MRDRIILDRDPTGVAIDLNNSGMHGIAPGYGRGLPIGDLFEAGLDPGRARVLPARPRRLRDLDQAQRRTGHADHADTALAQFEVRRRALQHVRGDRENLVAQFRARLMHRRRGGDCAAARHRAKADRDRGGVGEGQYDVFGLHLPQIGDDLGKDRFHALALRSGAAGDVDLAGGVDTHKRALERADPGALDVAANTEAEIAALAAHFCLTPSEGFDPADRVERLLQCAGIIAAVIDDRLAIAVRDAYPIWHLIGADHIAAAHLGGLQAQGARHEIYRTFHREGSFRAAGAAIGRIRHLVGDGNLSRSSQILDLVRAGQVHRGVVGDAGADRVPGAAIDEVIVADREDAAVIVEADFDIMKLVARMGGAHQMFAALLDPAHRATEPMSEKRDQQILGIDVALAAEAAADIERDAAHPRLRQAEQRGGLAPYPMHDLGRGPDRRGVGARIVGADDAAAFHRHRGVAVVIEAPLQAMRRARHRAIGIATADRKFSDQIGLQAVVHDRTVRPPRRLGIDHRRQFFQVPSDELGRVFGMVAAFRGDDRDCLADMSNFVMR